MDMVHGIIQQAMDWQFAHRHEFEVGNMTIGDARELCGWGLEHDPEVETRHRDALADLQLQEGNAFDYTYDSGDNWQHRITLEKILDRDPETNYPICMKAVRAAPPEDVGGIYGYQTMLEALDDPQHPSHEDFAEWIGEEWDSEAVDLQRIREAVSRVQVR